MQVLSTIPWATTDIDVLVVECEEADCRKGACRGRNPPYGPRQAACEAVLHEHGYQTTWLAWHTGSRTKPLHDILAIRSACVNADP